MESTPYRLCRESLFLLIIFVVHYNQCAPINDSVTYLPGWEGPLPSKQYSGYVDGDPLGTVHIHYWLSECESPCEPSTAPTILWLNGGPGSSSLYGYLTELGQFQVNDLSFVRATNDSIRLFHNPFGFQKTANILTFESPGGVGYSYCDNFTCPHWKDTSTAVSNYYGLVSFYNKFPEYRTNDLYIVGESYAGVYIPTLAATIIGNRPNVIPLAGVAIGNGCVGDQGTGPCGKDFMKWQVDFFDGHTSIARDLYDNIQTTCGAGPLADGTFSDNSACTALLNEMDAQVGGFDEYAFYDDCWGMGEALLAVPIAQNSWHNHTIRPLEKYHCGGDAGKVTWLNQNNTQTALNVLHGFWQEHDGAWGNYTSDVFNTAPYFKESLLGNIRILIYDGDEDTVAPVRAAEEFAANLGVPLTEPWRPWVPVNGSKVVYGYRVRYEQDLDFLTVKGTGHMVPLTTPMRGLSMISHWIHNKGWPIYPGDETPKVTPSTDSTNPTTAGESTTDSTGQIGTSTSSTSTQTDPPTRGGYNWRKWTTGRQKWWNPTPAGTAPVAVAEKQEISHTQLAKLVNTRADLLTPLEISMLQEFAQQQLPFSSFVAEKDRETTGEEIDTAFIGFVSGVSFALAMFAFFLPTLLYHLKNRKKRAAYTPIP